MRQTVIAVVLCFLVIIVAVQNLFSVTLKIGESQITISVATIIGLAFATGILFAILLLNKSKSADKATIMDLKRKIVFLETPDSYSKQD